MKVVFCILFTLQLLAVHSELVRLDFIVKGAGGLPIENAKIRISTNERQLFPYQKLSKKKMACTTDAAGLASERFFCWDGYVNCYISADGYYQKNMSDVFFKSDYNRKSGKTEFAEDVKRIEVQLLPKINPIPLYTYRDDNRRWSFGNKPSCVGYDLKLGDWLPPRGHGEIADFYVHHKIVETNGESSVLSKITFGQGCGAYVVKNEKNKDHVMVYQADTNASYRSVIEVPSHQNLTPSPQLLLDKDGAMVIRSRVKLDAEGRIASANYSKIYGPFSISMVFSFGQISFNPTVNDVNLEFDLHRNLSGCHLGVYYP